MVTYRNTFDASNLERFIAVYELDRERSLRTRPATRPVTLPVLAARTEAPAAELRRAA